MIRYYKVKEIKRKNNRTIYKVFSARNIFDIFFNLWLEYEKDNYILKDAINQIKVINRSQIVSKKTVYKVKTKDLDKTK